MVFDGCISQKGKISTPWPLKRERRVKGEEMLQRRMEATRRKDVTPETFPETLICRSI